MVNSCNLTIGNLYYHTPTHTLSLSLWIVEWGLQRKDDRYEVLHQY